RGPGLSGLSATRAGDVRSHPAPRAGRRGRLCGRPRGIGHAAAQHHRPGRRAPTDFQRRSVQGHRLQRRDLQLPRAAARAAAARTHIHVAGRYRDDSASLRRARSAVCRAAPRHVRVRHLGRDDPDVAPRARPVWHQAALCRGRALGIAFASELKALHETLPTERVLDWEALDMYLQLGYIPAPRTPFRDIRKLEPGHTATWHRSRGFATRQYWDLPPPSERRPDDLEAQVLQWLDEAVRAHLVSDVPVAAFLSGGLDSSAVVASWALASEAPHAYTA